jgi:hypothetical protein
MIWFKLWLLAMRHGLWRDPVASALTFLRSIKLALVIR